MTNPMMMPVHAAGPRPDLTSWPGLSAPTGTERAAGCSNCGSVRSVQVLPDGRHRCGCGHRWTPNRHGADGTP
ncbi:hypothetical protein SMC26_23635 [Actinomadura fulvescens]|uniref:Uncharacterized protein n=1 Tax=Actinomadura fulvescens TaxID=46160 RepID=A0ABN3QNI4_9ACTN